MTEAIIEPDLPIIDPHHHLWDLRPLLPVFPEPHHPFIAAVSRSPYYTFNELHDHHVQIVSRNDLAAGEFVQNRDQCSTSFRVETAERFVECQQARLTREDTGQTNPFPFTQAEPQRAARFVTAQTHRDQTLFDSRPHFVWQQPQI